MTEQRAQEVRERVAVHHFEEWHEDVGSVLWFLDPIQEPPYCGTPLDLGATWSLQVFDGIGQTVGERENHRFDVGGWPFAERHEPRLFWMRLPDLDAVQSAIRALASEGAGRQPTLPPESPRCGSGDR